MLRAFPTSFPPGSLPQAYVPRVGELVLWYHHSSGELGQDPTDRKIKLWDGTTNRFTDVPQWKAGIVREIAQSNQPGEYDETIDQEIILAGCECTIEWFCLNHIYPTAIPPKTFEENVPIRCLRPLAYFKQLLEEPQPPWWHLSITSALRAMTSFLATGKHPEGLEPATDVDFIESPPDEIRFQETAPMLTTGSYERSFLGHDAIHVGDVVRLHHQYLKSIADVMQVTKIKVKFQPLDFDKHEWWFNKGNDTQWTTIHYEGVAYTKVKGMSFDRQPVKQADCPQVMQGYGKWYCRFAKTDIIAVPPTGIIGRLLPAETVRRFFPLTSSDDLLGLAREEVGKARFEATVDLRSRMQARGPKSYRTEFGFDTFGFDTYRHNRTQLALPRFVRVVENEAMDDAEEREQHYLEQEARFKIG